MPLNENEVKHISHLARIGVSQEEIKKFQRELEEIIGYIDKLKSLDVDKIKPMAHVLPLQNIYRQDKKKGSLPEKEVLKNAPKKQDNFFVVPKIIE